MAESDNNQHMYFTPADQHPPQPGDLVKLRSGGPLMTFVRLNPPKGNEPPEAYCVWFAGDVAQAGTFPLTALETATH